MTQHIMKTMCSTCIFHPDNRMHLRKGRLADMNRETDRNDSNVICHKSKGLEGVLDVRAWCSGSVDRRPGQLVRIMERLGGLIEVEEPECSQPSPTASEGSND
jgi:hypothetical protein